MTTEATTVTRVELHALVDALPDGELAEAKRYLTGLNTHDDPALLAQYDDEPLTEEDVAAIEDGQAAIARGEYVTDEELGRLLEREGTRVGGRAVRRQTAENRPREG